MPPDPQPVDVVNVTGDALAWMKLLLITDLALGLALLTVVTLGVAAYLYRGRG